MWAGWGRTLATRPPTRPRRNQRASRRGRRDVLGPPLRAQSRLEGQPGSPPEPWPGPRRPGEAGAWLPRAGGPRARGWGAQRGAGWEGVASLPSAPCWGLQRSFLLLGCWGAIDTENSTSASESHVGTFEPRVRHGPGPCAPTFPCACHIREETPQTHAMGMRTVHTRVLPRGSGGTCRALSLGSLLGKGPRHAQGRSGDPICATAAPANRGHSNDKATPRCP